jgi:sugar lactone lactonase YvrE
VSTLAPGQTAPQAQGRGGRIAKAALALILLAGLGWVGIVATQYLKSGKPISQLDTVPAPIQKLVQEPPRYEGAIDGPSQPLGVAVAQDGRVYVTEMTGERLFKGYDAQGTLLFSVSTNGDNPGGRLPAYTAVAPNGDVYVTDLMARKLLRFTANGEPAGEVASPFEEGWRPQGITIDRNGKFYITEVTTGAHRVLVLDAEGNLIQQFGSEGSEDGQFSFPNSIAVDGAGNIYVSDSNNGRIQAFDPQGNLRWKIGRGTAAGDLSTPRGIVIDDSRHILFVVDTFNNAVKMYNIEGDLPQFMFNVGGDAVDDPSTFNFPNGIALDGNGHAYVTDRVNGRVTVWSY